MFNESSIVELAITVTGAHSGSEHLFDLFLIQSITHDSENVPEVRRAHVPAPVLVEHRERLDDLVGVLRVGVLDAHRLDELLLRDGAPAPVLVDDLLRLLGRGVLPEPVHEVQHLLEPDGGLPFAHISKTFLQFSKRVFVNL